MNGRKRVREALIRKKIEYWRIVARSPKNTQPSGSKKNRSGSTCAVGKAESWKEMS